MTSYVFVGPTLRAEEVSSVAPDAVRLPPVAQGDVYRVARQRPSAIGIIDGYFSGAPSVWHKEILWALSQGVPVFGSASMGALRAAELHSFGMRGVGRIFEAFRDGELEDDDEVAVVHGPIETGFLAASEPMVNMRATLGRACVKDIISDATRSTLEAAAKSLFFAQRSWPAVFEMVAGQDLSELELSAFKDWLPAGSVDQKRADALEMLASMQRCVRAGEVNQANFRFERTHFWDDLVERTLDEQLQSTAMRERILDELRLKGLDIYKTAMRKALSRMLADWEWRRRGLTIPAKAKSAASSQLRTALGLFSLDRLKGWMSENDLDEKSFDQLMEAEARLQILVENQGHSIDSLLLDELRLSGLYQRLSARARDKSDKLESISDHHPVVPPNPAQLRLWFFEDHLGQAVPEDINSFARALGFAGTMEFDRALLQEWTYVFISGSMRHSGRDADGDLPT